MMAEDILSEKDKKKNNRQRSSNQGSRKPRSARASEHGEFKIYDLNAAQDDFSEKRKAESSINTGESIKREALADSREENGQKKSIEPIAIVPYTEQPQSKKAANGAKPEKQQKTDASKRKREHPQSSAPESPKGTMDSYASANPAEPIENVIERKLVEQVENVAAQDPAKPDEPFQSTSQAGYGGSVWRKARTETLNRRYKDRRERKASGISGILFHAAEIVVFLAVVLWMGYRLLPGYCVKSEMTVEIGSNCPKVSEFLKWKNGGARFVSGINEETVFQSPGDYGVLIHVYGRDVASVVHVKDMEAPEVTTKNVTVFADMEDAVKPEDFIQEIKDATATTVSFKETPDYTQEGLGTVILVVEDSSGNKTEAEAYFEVVKDHEPPIIEGVKEITITEGSSVSYKKGITVTDNYDASVELIVDTGDADTTKPGDYTITYRAVDAAGNEAVETTTLHVKKVANAGESVTDETVNAAADELLSRIIDDSMSQYEKAKAIYWWCHDNIAYSDNTPKVNWTDGAYRGIVKRRGDCYTYAATAKRLLDRAGIANFDIERIRVGDSMHYWNVIDVGEGWHHFDTCRRADGSTFFYKTDAELMEYSESHNGTHNYDRSLYPAIP